jgi:hypothetical protein
LTGYEAFCVYQALKLHFNVSSYDYFKYNGKVSVSMDAFDNRKDKYYFHKISRKYNNKEELVDFLVANFMHDPNLWIGKLLDEDANQRYLDYQKVLQSLGYIFENECRDLFQSVDEPNELVASNGEHPILLKKVLRSEISVQTLIILNKLLNFIPMWNKKINDTIVWPNYYKKIEKYTPFFNVDLTKYKLIVKKCLT